jgi:hypothetical protein
MATASEIKPIPVVNNVITDEEITFDSEKVKRSILSYLPFDISYFA